MREARRLGHVEVVSGLPEEPVGRAAVLSTTPVIVRGADVLGRVREWTPEHISERIGEREVPISVADPDGAFRYDPDSGGLRFEPIRGLDLAAEFRAATTDRKLCMQQMPIETKLPELFGELSVPRQVPADRLNEVNLWMASAGSSTPLHYDDMHNVFAQIVGRKRFLLFNPAQFDLLYCGPLNTRTQHLSRIDVKAPDVERFPRLRQAEYWEAVVEPGDLLFMPAFWFHQVSSPDLSVSVNYWWRPDVRDCASPAFFRELYMNSVLEDVRGLFRVYDLDELGVGARAVLAVAERALAQDAAGAAARLCGGVIVTAVRDAAEEYGIAAEDRAPQEMLADLAAKSVWSAADLELADQGLAAALAARPARPTPPADVRALIAALRKSALLW